MKGFGSKAFQCREGEKMPWQGENRNRKDVALGTPSTSLGYGGEDNSQSFKLAEMLKQQKKDLV